MAKFRPEDYFVYKNVNPGSMQENNIVTFSYKSPNGIHDNSPMVIVTDKQSDRFYGINLHYDPRPLDEAMKNIENKILPFLEKEYFNKYPENKQKLNEQKIKFHKGLITEQEYHQMMLKFPKKDLEVFKFSTINKEAMRCYIYHRMTAVSRLVWKA